MHINWLKVHFKVDLMFIWRIFKYYRDNLDIFLDNIRFKALTNFELCILEYQKEYLKHLVTTISFLYQGSIDGRFSYVYNGDFNRDGVNGNDLLYIPTVDQVQQMQFSSQTVNGVVYDQNAQRGLFESYILQDKYLSKHRGQYAERNGAQIPWRNQMDFKFMQDIFVKAGKNRNTLQFTCDIFNFGNLLNPSWGKVKTINASQILVPQNQNSLIPGGSVIQIGNCTKPDCNKNFQG